MPSDATHILFADEAARRASPRLLLPQLLQGAIAPDSVGDRRLLRFARSHSAASRSARLLRAATLRKDPEVEAFAFGYLSHVWLDRFVARWLPRHPLTPEGRRLSTPELCRLIGRRDAEQALSAWRALSCRSAPPPQGAARFVDPLGLARYCEEAERRLLAEPPLDDDVEAAAIFASERLRTAALARFLPWVSFPSP